MRLLENYANGFLLESTLAYRDSVYRYSFERERAKVELLESIKRIGEGKERRERIGRVYRVYKVYRV